MTSKKRKAAKASLLTLGTGLLPFAVQQSLQAHYYTGGVAAVIGAACITGYVVVDDLDKLPIDADQLEALSQAIGEELDERTST